MPRGARCLWGVFPLFHWLIDCFQFVVGKRKVTVMFEVGRVGLGLTVEHLQWVVSSTGASEHKASLCFLRVPFLPAFYCLECPLACIWGMGFICFVNALLKSKCPSIPGL